MSTAPFILREAFTEGDLFFLGRDPYQPQHQIMRMMGKITLCEVSPFGLLKAQTQSLADFMRIPWSSNADDVCPYCDDELKSFESEILSDPVPINMALGLMTVVEPGQLLLKSNHLSSSLRKLVTSMICRSTESTSRMS